MTDLSDRDDPLGATRTERVRVFRPNEAPLELEVYRVVNVVEDPQLREPALSGTLHRLDDGEDVEVPFLYHDPDARQLVLVIPDGARGRELSERGRLLDRLMREPEDAVPPYMRQFGVVYGHHGLRERLDDALAMEVRLEELEPVDITPPPASYFPSLAPRLPDAGFFSRPSHELGWLLDDDSLWLFVCVDSADPADPGGFDESSSDLLIQLKVADRVPVFCLTLLDDRTRGVRRAFLDPSSESVRLALDRLGREFSAIVVVLDESMTLVRSFTLEGPRTDNARLIRDRTRHAPKCSEEAWDRAVEACRAFPPPVDRVDHPFSVSSPAVHAGEARERLQRLEVWASPDKADEALLLRGVPGSVYEVARRRIVADAVRFGLAMSDVLVTEAVRFGLAADPAALVAELSDRFEAVLASPTAHGLGPDEVDSNRAALRRLGSLHGTSTGPDLSCNMNPSG